MYTVAYIDPKTKAFIIDRQFPIKANATKWAMWLAHSKHAKAVVYKGNGEGIEQQLRQR